MQPDIAGGADAARRRLAEGSSYVEAQRTSGMRISLRCNDPAMAIVGELCEHCRCKVVIMQR